MSGLADRDRHCWRLGRGLGPAVPRDRRDRMVERWLCVAAPPVKEGGKGLSGADVGSGALVVCDSLVTGGDNVVLSYLVGAVVWLVPKEAVLFCVFLMSSVKWVWFYCLSRLYRVWSDGPALLIEQGQEAVLGLVASGVYVEEGGRGW